MKSRRKRAVAAGLTLIALGLAFYFFRRFEGAGEGAVFVIIGAAFLAGYLYNKSYGLMVPAGILLGLGVGTIAEEWLTEFGNPTLLGLGLGFVSIYLVTLVYERTTHWWPLVPGAALLVAGFPDGEEIFGYLFENWPLVLVIVGVIILIGAFTRKGGSPDSGAGS